jgi:hypothetical protein
MNYSVAALRRSLYIYKVCYTLPPSTVYFHTRSTLAQAANLQPVTMKARVWSRVSPCRICGGQSGSGTGLSYSAISNFFLQNWCFPPVNIFPPMLHTHVSFMYSSHAIIFLIASVLKTLHFSYVTKSMIFSQFTVDSICCRMWTLFSTINQWRDAFDVRVCKDRDSRLNQEVSAQDVIGTCCVFWPNCQPLLLFLTTVDYTKYDYYLWHFLSSWFSSDTI